MKKTQGIALILVLAVLTIIASLVVVSSLLALTNRNSSSDTVLSVQTQAAAEAGIEEAMSYLFYEPYRRWVLSGEGGSAIAFDNCAYKKWLTGIWSGSSSNTSQAYRDLMKADKNNNEGCFYTGATSPTLPNATDSVASRRPVAPSLYTGVQIPLDSDPSAAGVQNWTYGNSSVELTVLRRDDNTNSEINLVVTSTAKVLSGSSELSLRRIQRTLRVGGAPFPGDEFAMLTNDINCSFCHLQVDNMKRVYTPSTDTTSRFRRVKLGTLNAINFNGLGHNNDTLIAGTVYSRGTAAPSTGTDVYLAPWASASEPGLTKAGTNASIGTNTPSHKYNSTTPSGSGYSPTTNLAESAALDAAGTASATPFGKLYYNYPRPSTITGSTWNGNWPDGEVPEKFPSIVKENPTTTDGLLDDAEWSAYIGGAPSGTLATFGNAVVYGVGRAGSTAFGPASFDPVSANTAFAGTRVGDLFGAVRFRPVVNVQNTPMTLAALIADITDLNAVIRATQGAANAIFNPASAPVFVAPTLAANFNAAYTGTIQQLINGFAIQWRGWLVQQALASPNNRDFRPTNNTADNVLNAGPNFAPIQPPSAINNNGLARNNFWVAYSPQANTMSVAFCTQDPCVILRNTDGSAVTTANAVSQPAGTVGIRNINLITSATSLQNIAMFQVPVTQTTIFPQTSNSAAADLASGTNSGKSGYFNGNLIVDAGRMQDSTTYISITGTIHVNGDLVIRGKVLGQGRLLVRGNVYIVGDLVYQCPDSNGACLTNDGATNPSYRNSEGLPKLAVLAGGSVIVGDYDHPDFRANRSQLNLINDQIGQNRQPSAPSNNGAIAFNQSWLYQTIPGQTGTNRVNSGAGMGFAPMIAAFGNQSSRPASRPVFQSAPFGLLVSRSGFGQYEGTQIDSTTRAITTLSPSNGVLRTGDSTTGGLVGSAVSNVLLGCTAAASVSNNAPIIPTNINADTTNRAPLHMGYWCPPSVGKFFRTWSSGTSANGPASDTSAWTLQPTGNQGLDGGAGMTTGWLAGVLRSNGGVGFDTLGDLSQTKLLKLMWLNTMETTADRDPNTAGQQSVGPLRTDGLLYSANSLFAVARFYMDQRTSAAGGPLSNTQARWLHHGSLLSFELGFLLTGNAEKGAAQFTVNRATPIDFTPATATTDWQAGPAMGVFWDERLSGLLGLGGKQMSISRGGVFTQVAR